GSVQNSATKASRCSPIRKVSTTSGHGVWLGGRKQRNKTSRNPLHAPRRDNARKAAKPPRDRVQFLPTISVFMERKLGIQRDSAVIRVLFLSQPQVNWLLYLGVERQRHFLARPG